MSRLLDKVEADVPSAIYPCVFRVFRQDVRSYESMLVPVMSPLHRYTKR